MRWPLSKEIANGQSSRSASSSRRFKSFWGVQGEVFFLLTSTYHGCPRVCPTEHAPPGRAGSRCGGAAPAVIAPPHRAVVRVHVAIAGGPPGVLRPLGRRQG